MRVTLLIVMLCISISVSGQSIKGQVTDKEDHSLEFVTVTLVIDSLHKKVHITDLNGKYDFTNLTKSQTYRLKFDLIGYRHIDTSITVSDDAVVKVKLATETKQLKQVLVTARKKLIERKIDRLVFNVENNINTVGSDALDILSKTPMVRVDDIHISIVGKEEVAVLIDNRLTHLSGQALASMLKSINGDNIARIEVITNPPSEYDAQGNSGLLNIITKKQRTSGLSGTATSNLTVNTYTTVGEGLNLNYNVDKLLLFAGINSGHGANGPTGGESRLYQLQSWDAVYNSKERQNFYSGNIGFDYLVSKKTTVGASFSGFTSRPNNSGTDNTTIINRQSGMIDSILKVNYFNRKLFNTKTFNVHLSQKLDSAGKEFTFDADYYKSTSDISNNSLNSNVFADGSPTLNPANSVRSDNNLAAHGYTLNAVFKLPFKKVSFTVGGKASFISSNSIVSIDQVAAASNPADTSNENNFHFNENTEAVFVSVNSKLGKWGFQAGLRAEDTQTKGFSESLSQINQNSYFSIFPTVYITYEVNKDNILALNYGRRIGRPNFSSFNPYRIYINQYQNAVGNPNLKPSFSNNIELSNTFKQLLTTTLSYSFNNHLALSVPLIENGSNTQSTVVGNYLSSQSFLFDNSITTDLFKWFQTTDEISVYYNISKSSSPNTQSRVDGLGADFSTNNSFFINKSKTLLTGFDFIYQFPYTSGISKQRRYYYTDLTASYLLLHKKMQLTVSLRDVFKTKNVEWVNQINNIQTITTANNDSRRFLINLKYSFGNTRLRKGQSHNSSSAEQNRSGH